MDDPLAKIRYLAVFEFFGFFLNFTWIYTVTADFHWLKISFIYFTAPTIARILKNLIFCIIVFKMDIKN